MKTFASALAAMSLLAAPALAGGMTTAPAPMAPPLAFSPEYNWTGFSVGAQLGYGDVDTNVDSLDGDDVVYGLRAYYDYDFGRFVLGGGVQYDATSIELGDNVDEVDSITRVGLRAGFDSGRNYYYATGGYAYADTENDSSDGYFVGLGYEVFATQNVTLGAEVLYHEFDDFDGGLEADATTASLSVNYRF
ncbi:hypothetical protein PARPLA_01501 [Rhodobacteraceae bacterium THAF1]|uniref:outer membrane protein n=1 Tax=Palleronia sp. THAF1 TaxID=2587842 RepID=UPI000F3F34E2|nr:outer membrane beta-barrel protein [Palleronia sp. THAF1]QFU07590.1 hypothetical protein FIU81_02750 [Palleronia sp. THAF1]VDC22838.1 hypothetical protein PARPLA_01501 [Rhodobacteraceae bacterium THAF1]